MSPLASDNFDRANEGPPPSSSWVNVINGLKVVGNECKGNAGSAQNNVSFWNEVLPADVEVRVRVSAKGGTNQYMSIYARMTTTSSSTMDGYAARLDPKSGTDQVSIYRITNGTPTLISNVATYEMGGDEDWRFRLSGNDLSVDRWDGDEWITVVSVADGTYSGGGYVGLGIVHTTGVLDDFEVEEISNALEITPAPVTMRGVTVNPSVLLALILSPNPASAKVLTSGPVVIGGGVNPLGEGDSPGFIVFMLARSLYVNLTAAGLDIGLDAPDKTNASAWADYLFD